MAKDVIKKLKQELRDDPIKITREDIARELKKGTDIGEYLDQKGIDGEIKQRILDDIKSYAVK